MDDDDLKPTGEDAPTDDNDKDSCGCQCNCGDDECDDDSCCCCCGDVSADNLAMAALGAGVASLFLTTQPSPFLRFAGLALAAFGVVGGFKAQEVTECREKQAIGGFVCGVIGLVFWLCVQYAPHLLFWVH